MTAANRLPPDAIDALARGETIEAIKRVRAATGLGLKEAKDLVDAYRHPGGGATSHAPGSGPSIAGRALNVTDASTAGGALIVPSAAATALQRGNIIEAIKLIRDANRLGLKEAKDAVEHLRTGPQTPSPLHAHPRRMPTVMQGDRGLGGWIVLAAVVITAFAWWLLSL
ncbi:MAG: ribosomal protein L7/L12 [Luteimonas sp.]|nr:ribosomal protein L7/L12 [Luteimonas sp.]